MGMLPDFTIVTGASRGLGQAVAEELLDKGDFVVTIARSDSTINSERHRHFRADLGDLPSVPSLISSIFASVDLKKFAAINLVNNAAIIQPVGPVDKIDPMKLAENINTNLTSPIILSGAFLRATAKHEGERAIINVSSGVASSPLPSWSAYSATKAGLDNFTQALALENEGDRLFRAIIFNPGIMDTEMQATIRKVDEMDFAHVGLFRGFKESGQLRPPSEVGAKIVKILKSPTLRDLNYAV